MFNDLVIGPLLGITEPEDRLKHWNEMQMYALLPLMEDNKILFRDSLENFPEHLRKKVKSVIVTVGYTKSYTA